MLGGQIRAQSGEGTLAPAGESNSGNVLMVRMLENFERHASMTAKVRHQCRLYDDTLVGSGNYWQQGSGDQSLTCFEMQTQMAGKTASFIQIYDGKHLWTDRNFQSGRMVRRLEVARLQSSLAAGGKGAYQKRLAAASVRGGVSQMLADLQHRFDFDPPLPMQLNGTPVHALVGHWRKSGLKELWPDFDTTTEEGEAPEWPAQLPHHVLLLVGQGNLFPYVIEHRRFEDAYLVDTVTGLRPANDPLLRYELFNVQFAVAIDPQKFVYKTGGVEWTDETMAVMGRLNLQRR